MARMSAETDRPIFIVSPHRSGTTLLYGILGSHEKLGYYNRANRRVPNHPRVALWMTKFGLADDPMEAQKIWDRFWDGGDDVMDESHATPEVTEWFRRSVEEVVRLRGATRFVAKYPRLSMRMRWIDAIFPGAIFVHIQRDWRAVVNSTVARIEKRRARGGGWFGVRIPGWKSMEDLSPERIAGRVFRIVTERIEEDGATFGDRYIAVRYEDLCASPRDFVRDLADRCGLEWNAAFEQRVPESLTSANTKWRERLDPHAVEEIRAEAPAFYGRYEAPDPVGTATSTR